MNKWRSFKWLVKRKEFMKNIKTGFICDYVKITFKKIK